ncbi:serine protease snake-like [Tribolium madens]|uniref:serine protease snake-like n=1 Tax=Tribolium madens TaxID=41895 RepID=UPI001CF76506|nr:serine protease snake-like [Tribolium madens]
MLRANYLRIFVIVTILNVAYNQQFVGDVCTLTSSGAPGVCKLFIDCQQAREDIKKHVFPQTCGFEGTQAIVCCPSQNQKEQQKSKRQPGEISKRKCREYSAYIYEVTKSPVLLIGTSDLKRNECGHEVVKLIVGGELAGRKEFPHMAVIGFEPTRDEKKWLCGGTIISKQYILTAAHCLSHHEHGEAKYVRIGASDYNDKNRRQELKIEERIPHPEYKSSSHYHDIGLLKLETEAKMNPYARPACLFSRNEIPTERAIATGWGHTTWAGEGSNKLLKVTLDLFDHNTCNASYKNQISRRLKNGIVDDLQVCAGSKDGEEKDTCQGDSGGPLQIYHFGDEIVCMYDIIGITSFGKGCAGSPGVYVRVSHYIKWIEDIVWPEI